MLLLQSLALVGLAAALPVEEANPTDCPTLCIDGVNDCGVAWGGCYDTCQPSLSPIPPPCATTTTPPSTNGCSGAPGTGKTVYWDGVNECGMTYGGSFPDCSPWPTFTPPPCPETTDEPTTTTTTKEDDCSTRTVCWDGINDCGMMYGGCFADCTPWPTFTPPPCPESSTTTTTTTTDECPTICADYINDCGMGYGGCFEHCEGQPWPTFSVPPCPEPSTTTTTTLGPESTNECPTICADYVNDCGMWYGGCFEHCEGEAWPTFSAPPCPTATGRTYG